MPVQKDRYIQKQYLSPTFRQIYWWSPDQHSQQAEGIYNFTIKYSMYLVILSEYYEIKLELTRKTYMKKKQQQKKWYI